MSDRSPTGLPPGHLYNHGRLGKTVTCLFRRDQASTLPRRVSRPIRSTSTRTTVLLASRRLQRHCLDPRTLAMVSRRYVHRIPFMSSSTTMTCSLSDTLIAHFRVPSRRGFGPWLGATVYSFRKARFATRRSARPRRSSPSRHVPVRVLLRNDALDQRIDYHLSADLTGRPTNLGWIRPTSSNKAAQNNGGYNAVKSARRSRVYSELTSDNPIDLTRWQSSTATPSDRAVNPAGEAKGSTTSWCVRTAVINKRRAARPHPWA